MPRTIDATMLAALKSNAITPAILLQLGLSTGTVYVWSGVGSLVYGGNTYIGVGDLGKVDGISEGSDVRAYGTRVTLSGINPVLLNDSLAEIQLGAPATILLALLNASGAIIGTPQTLFVGTVDKPTISPGVKEVTISLALENKLSNLQRANQRRYTAADQNLYYPKDGFFNWVEQLNDQALKWTP